MALFTLTEARGLMPEVLRRAARYVELRADFAEANAAARAGDPAPAGGLAELKSLEARMHEQLEWFGTREIQVKGAAPLLIDFPAVADGRDILLCWLEGEPELAWYHAVELGFMGRRRIDDLTAV
ncbi:MAG: DUF2203 domain-containing protein [Egibacteraceae bacterium]